MKINYIGYVLRFIDDLIESEIFGKYLPKPMADAQLSFW